MCTFSLIEYLKDDFLSGTKIEIIHGSGKTFNAFSPENQTR
ncbi:hypothetical protein HMPREF0650_1564 [Hoylesella buccalis ATCC 35310]|uniref:Uncharacterized protein n=1 Tax=Hoylesella buccalis ATCC 35310 TaxID=679190 RepID=D1W5X7_9BACT|nr:hypothetical protein HMPREF0650_1564 [Hoylesella buccalis ATCC 35310]